MPSANGVYSLPLGYLAVTGQTIQASQHNPPLEDIALALTARLSRDGTAAMNGALQLAPGTVSLPGAAFSTDLTTGLYKTTSGIGVAVSGSKIAEFTAAGLASGVWFPGMMIPWTLSTVPSPLWVLPYGQTLSRTTYAALWALAQAEIAAGNTFYNNGDGSTTFGIGDMRGRVPAGKDNMGGSAAGRITSTVSNSSSVGGVGGVESNTLITANLPSVTSTQTLSVSLNPNGNSSLFVPTSTNGVSGDSYGNGSNFNTFKTAGAVSYTNVFSGTVNISATSQGTNSQAITNLQPTMITNWMLYAGGS